MMAHAEGIETELQLRLLRESGCGQGQGFLFSRAIPAEEILNFDFVSRQARVIPTPTLKQTA
jgi:EAL domain-containing protein (putative c-di-GMP-specific phosphodiesterase class I)